MQTTIWGLGLREYYLGFRVSLHSKMGTGLDNLSGWTCFLSFALACCMKLCKTCIQSRSHESMDHYLEVPMNPFYIPMVRASDFFQKESADGLVPSIDHLG